MSTRITRDELAQRIAADIREGSYVNLGIGAPTLVANFLPEDQEIILHTENGLLGMGQAPDAAHVDPDLINAGKQAVTALPGAAYFHHADSFGMMRGGHLDVCVLGAFQVSQTGDLANWSTGAPGAIPAVGGAMDLAIGAKAVYVMTDLLTKTGESKLVAECTYPLTGVGLRHPRLHRPRRLRRHRRRLRRARGVRRQHRRLAGRADRTRPGGCRPRGIRIGELT